MADILKNYDPTLAIKMENVRLVDMNTGCFNATASLTLTKGGSVKHFPIRVDLTEDKLTGMTKTVLENMGTGFGFLHE